MSHTQMYSSIRTDISNGWNTRYVNILENIKVNAFVSRLIVYESALNLQNWNKLFKWPPILLLSIPTIIESYGAIYTSKWWYKPITLGTIVVSAAMKSWHESREYNVNIEKFKNTYDELSRIIDEINYMLAKDNDNRPSPDEFVVKILERFAEIRKKLPLIPKDIHEKYFGTKNISDIKNINDLLNYNLRDQLNCESINATNVPEEYIVEMDEKIEVKPDSPSISPSLSVDTIIIHNDDTPSDQTNENNQINENKDSGVEKEPSMGLYAYIPNWIGSRSSKKKYSKLESKNPTDESK